MLVFHNCLLSYNSFLEEISFNVIENNNISSSSREKIKQVNKSLKQLNKNNKFLKNKIVKNEILGIDGKLKKIFDITTVSNYSEIKKIALAHFFLEIFLDEIISLKRIFKKRNCSSKIWEKINYCLDELLFQFGEADYTNAEPSLRFEIL